MKKQNPTFAESVHERLIPSSVFQTYQNAFQIATGLPLILIGTDTSDVCISDQSTNHSSFCEALHLCKSACGACIDTNRRLLAEASVAGPVSCHCFAGLIASAVPVRIGSGIIGYLKTGQVFSRPPDEAQFSAAMRSFGRDQMEEHTKEVLRKAYFETRTIDPQRYASMLTLLQSFAEQLGSHAESLAIIEEGREPAAIAKARNYVHANLGESITLGEVARVAGLSDSHFCRSFKQVTGLTLTEYVNRSRIEWAKEELLKRGRRVSEIAFEVGYQSLSQFNRNFLHLTGAAPTPWREAQLAEAGDPLPAEIKRKSERQKNPV